MAPLKLAIVAALLAATPPARAQNASDPVARWRPYVAEASLRFGIPSAWIERVMRAESGGQTRIDGRPITSRAGAMGLMQLMPGTWAEMRAALDLGDDPYDPRDNILAGTAYLRRMYRRFGYPGLFAAYNAGPGRYAAYLKRERTLPAETRTYLEEVASSSAEWAATAATEAPPPSIFAVNMVDRTANAAAPAAPSNGLFAIRIGR
jgi:soluble lytic murein transglycosylase-like protein